MLKDTQDSQASDLQARDLQATDLEASTNYKSKLEWMQMGKCTKAAAASRNSTKLIQPNSVP